MAQDTEQGLKRFQLHPEAVDEFNDALFYYGARDSGSVADRLNDKINASLDDIAAHPRRYPFWNKTRFRRCVITRFPYVVFYENEPGRVHVLAIAHTSRRPGYWKSRIAVA
jgi:toxin ParE1/3/4